MKWRGLCVAATMAVAGASCAAAAAAALDTKPPPMAASQSASSDPAAAARNQIIKDALAELEAAQVSGQKEAEARPWHWTGWLSGSGKVGRLYDMCTGAVEPGPGLAVPQWSWETLDPRGLSPADRRKLVEWQKQQVLAAYGCGTVFELGTLSSDAHKRLPPCPDPADEEGSLRDVKAFIAYVHRRPGLRASDDVTGAVVDALRADGC